jgi:hypothetical protein
MHTPNCRILLLALGAVFPLATSAYATSLLVGTTLPSTGNAFAEISVSSAQVLAEDFTLTTAVEITDIAVDMSGYGTDSFTLWVTNAIGPAATADNVLFQASLTFPETGGGLNGAAIVSTPLDLFLSPGSWFLVESSEQTSVYQGWIGGRGVSAISTPFGSVGPGTNSCCSPDSVFPPDSTFAPASELAFQISGDQTPEPPSFALFLSGGLGLITIALFRLSSSIG